MHGMEDRLGRIRIGHEERSFSRPREELHSLNEVQNTKELKRRKCEKESGRQ